MLDKVSGSTLYEKIVWQIKNAIANGVYKKGDLLPSEKEIMEMTGVSRVTVREALRVLADIGVIETKKGKGSFVLVNREDPLISEFMANTIGEHKNNFIYSTNVRLMIEPEITRRATELCTREDLTELKELVREGCDEHLESFHRRIFCIVDQSDFLEFFDRLTSLENTPPKIHLTPLLAEGTTNYMIVQEQHEKVLEAMQQKNPEFAYFYMKEHLQFLKSMYEEYFRIFD